MIVPSSSWCLQWWGPGSDSWDRCACSVVGTNWRGTLCGIGVHIAACGRSAADHGKSNKFRSLFNFIIFIFTLVGRMNQCYFLRLRTISCIEPRSRSWWTPVPDTAVWTKNKNSTNNSTLCHNGRCGSILTPLSPVSHKTGPRKSTLA